MQAIVYERYGTPDVLHVQDVPTPVPGDHEVLVRLRAAPVTVVDCIFRQGDQLAARLYTGLMQPRHAILGALFSGEVAEVGAGVTRYRRGDAVFGASGFGAHAEYVCVPEDAAMTAKPAGLSHEGAAAICEGALTALPFLRDTGGLQPGQRVLIHGASGSVGTAAVQLARHLGAHVTGVCSTRNAALVESLGAEHVIDYTQEDFTQRKERYDIVFDAAGKTSFRACRRVLEPSGVYLSPVIGLKILAQMAWTSVVGGKQARFAATGARPAADRARDLERIGTMLSEGVLTPVIDRSYALQEAAEAHRYVDTGHKQGNVVLAFGPAGQA